MSLGCFQRLADLLYDNLASVILVLLSCCYSLKHTLNQFLFVSKCSNLDLFTQTQNWTQEQKKTQSLNTVKQTIQTGADTNLIDY